ncbi:MAG: nucleotidyltransferase domain-containing protein [Gemmatimonadetes bacterium]|nr:nucleotidyltransferase domain-containing protein [Gemmatimonadota bacterium]
MSPRQAAAARRLVRRVRREVDADLVQASLFGSRARGTARPDSDVDILLVFRWLPGDREPQASHAEWIAECVARRSRVPVTCWSVSLADLDRGSRTPMLVDALTDSIPIWSSRIPIPQLPFTCYDAIWCSERLLMRLGEGSMEVAQHLHRGDAGLAARRARDDVVRLCTALLLLRGITRPRRGDAVDAVIWRSDWQFSDRVILKWAATSFGVSGTDESGPVRTPPGGIRTAAGTISRLIVEVEDRLSNLRARTGWGTSANGRGIEHSRQASSLRRLRCLRTDGLIHRFRR